MGFLDALKKFGSTAPPAADPQHASNGAVDITLPPGWQFTLANEQQFVAAGPTAPPQPSTSRCSTGARQHKLDYLKSQQVEASKDEILKLLRGYILKGAPTQTQGPDGVLWLEANQLDGPARQLQFAFVNSKPATR